MNKFLAGALVGLSLLFSMAAAGAAGRQQEVAAGRTVAPVYARQAQLVPDPLVREMIDQVTETAVIYSNGALSGEWPVQISGQTHTLRTRYTYSRDILNATQYAAQRLARAGLSVRFQQWEEGLPPNVVADMPGYERGEPVYLLTAHLDDISGDKYFRAPGADDNGSGSAAVLVAADILSRYRWQCNLRLALWTGEEQGLLGSLAYAREAAAGGEAIAGVLNLDMIGYNGDDQPLVDVHSRGTLPDSLALAQLFADAVEGYQLGLTPELLVDYPSGFRSDNAAFWSYHFPAILVIEDRHDFTPYYHSTRDTLSTLDPAYMTAVVRAALATFAHLTGCYEAVDPASTVTGRVAAADGMGIGGAAVTFTQAGETIATVKTGAGGSYSLTVPAGTYSVAATAAAYEAATNSAVEVGGGGAITQNFTLAPGDACAGATGVFLAPATEPVFAGPAVPLTVTTIPEHAAAPLTYELYVDGQEVGGPEIAGAGTFTVSVPLPASGTHRVTVGVRNCAEQAGVRQTVQLFAAEPLRELPPPIYFPFLRSSAILNP